MRAAGVSLPSDRFSVMLHTDPLEALASMRQQGVDVAVLELQLGDYGGFAVARDLDGFPSTRDVRLVMICERPHDRWLCREAGADAVLVKPLSDPSALAEAIDSALVAAGRDEASGSARAGGPGAGPAPGRQVGPAAP